MPLIDRLKTSYKYVVKNSKFVKINYAKVDEMIEKLDESRMTHWLSSNPFNVLDMDGEEIITFLLIYHAIGDYCLWGDPKWEIETPDGKLDGTYAILYLIMERLKRGLNFDINFGEYKEWLKSSAELSLLKERYDDLVQMNKFIEQYDKKLVDIIKSAEDAELLEFLVEHLPFLKDEAEYDGKTIYFYKRAQLLTSDLLHVLKIKYDIKKEQSNLIGCADYKIPQVMRCYGLLEFEPSLAHAVDSYRELIENSPEEIEIRAGDLEVIDYIHEKTRGKYSRMEINNYIWLLGQDKSKMTKPYHRTLTKHY